LGPAYATFGCPYLEAGITLGYHSADYLSADYLLSDDPAADKVILSPAATGVRVPKTQESRDGRGRV